MFDKAGKAKGKISAVIGKFESMVTELEGAVAVLKESIALNKTAISELQTENELHAADIAKALSFRDKLAAMVG